MVPQSLVEWDLGGVNLLIKPSLHLHGSVINLGTFVDVIISLLVDAVLLTSKLRLFAHVENFLLVD